MWLGGILVAVMAALFAVPHFIDWNGYRGVFEEEASRIFGRDVRVGGAVNVRLLPTPYVRFEGLRIADTTGVTGAPLFSADNFTMWLSVPPLLKGVLEARRVELEKPVVRLAVDRAGRPNWTNLTIRPGGLPFVPADVTLQSVFVKDGEIAYDAAGVGTLARVTGIEGELSAGGLRGPFSFRGTVGTGADSRQIRMGTGEITEASTTRLQVVVDDAPERPGGPRHTLEGEVSGLDGKPTFKGALKSTARMSEAKDAPAMDARADVEASTSAAKLENLIVAFETAGTPQIVTGSLGAAWGARHKVRVDLASRWLDLDRLASPLGAKGESAPQETADTPPAAQTALPLSVARRLFAGLLTALPPADDLDAGIVIEQVTLGGEAVSDVRIALKGDGGPLELRTLSASLPGGARIDFSGRVIETASTDEAAVDGTVFVGGPSLARVIKWAMPSYERLSAVSDGQFTVTGRMMLGDREVALSDATAELSGNPVRGSVSWRDGDAARFALDAEGYRIDTRWFGFDSLRLVDLLDRDGAGAAAQPGAEADGSGSTAQSPGAEVTIRVRAGRFLNGEDTLEDFDFAATSSAKGLEIERLAFETPDGLGLALEGRFDGPSASTSPSASPRGDARYTLSAGGPDAGAAAGRLLVQQGLADEDDGQRVARLLRTFAPARFAGSLALGQTGARALDIALDGAAGGRRVVASLNVADGLARWKASPLALNLDVETADAVSLLARILPQLTGADAGLPASAGRAPSGADRAPGASGRLILAVAGTPEQGMSWTGDARAPDLDATFDLAARLEEAGLAVTSGTVDVTRGRAGDLLALAGVDIGPGAGDTAVDGRFQLAADAGTLSVTATGTRFGETALEGRLALTYPRDGARGPVAISGELAADRLTLAGLMEGILSEGAIVAPPALVASRPLPVPPTLSDALSSGGPDVAEAFTDRPFDLSPAAALSGRIDIAAEAIELDPGLVVADAGLALAFDGAGGLAVTLAEGKSAAGAITGTFELTPAAAATGAELKGRLALAGGDLHALLARPDGTSLAKGTAVLEATFEGRGLAPRALLGALKGEGMLKIDGTSLAGLSPVAVAGAAQAVLMAPPEAGTAEDLLPQVRAALETGELAFGSVEMPFRLVDGAARFAELAVSQGAGRTTGVTTVDLVRLAVDSAWKVEAPAPSEGKPSWPPVSVVWVGPLRDIGALEPRIDLGAFERELAVRKMERNVERLERLRAEDEARAAELRQQQEELERLRAEEQARAREAVRRQLERERARQNGGGNVSPWTPGPQW